MLEANKLGLMYKRNNNTRDEIWTHKFLLNFLKSVTAAASAGAFSLSLSPPPYI